MVVHVYSCLLTGIITWNGTGIFMNIHEYSSLFIFLKFQESSVQPDKPVTLDDEFHHAKKYL